MLQNLNALAINTRAPVATTAAIPVGGGGAALPYNPAVAPDVTPPSPLSANIIDNSEFDYSNNDYLLIGAGDPDYECFHWYRQRFIKVINISATSGSNVVSSASNPFSSAYTYPMDFVLVNGGAAGAAISGYMGRFGSDGQAFFATDAGLTIPLNVSNTITNGLLWFGDSLTEDIPATMLKAAGDSLFAANEGTNTRIPRWDRTNGWTETGSNTGETWDVACPLPINYIRPGMKFFFKVIVALRSGASMSVPLRIGAGIWDATSTKKQFLESGNLDVTATTVGTAGSTTYNYRLLADVDDGTTIMSDLEVLGTGNAVLSASNYNRLTWTNAANLNNFRIYRSVGGVVKRIFTIRNGAHDYNDHGTDEGETPGSMPTAGITRPITYKVSPAFTLTSSTDWQVVRIPIEIPASWDSSSTTGKQWLRICIEGTPSDTRALLIDRILLSTQDGNWQKSAWDENKALGQSPTSLPTSSAQGNAGIDGTAKIIT